MADHVVPGAYGQALGVPGPDQRLGRLRLGEAAVHPHRLHQSGPAGWWWRRRRPSTPPGTSTLGQRVDALPRREHVQDRPGRRGRRSSRSTRSPTRSSQAGCGPPKKFSTLRRAMAAKSSRRSYEVSRPCSARPPAAGSRSAHPDPAPASTTRAPGKMSALDQDLGGVLGVDDGGAARHGHGELVEQRPQRQERGAADRGAPPRPPGRRSGRRAATAPLVVWNAPAGGQHDRVPAALGVGQGDPLPRPGSGPRRTPDGSPAGRLSHCRCPTARAASPVRRSRPRPRPRPGRTRARRTG